MKNSVETTPSHACAVVTVKNGRAITTSRKVADAFGKKHYDVLKSVRALECSEQFREGNFSLSKYQAGNREYGEYEISRDGFAFLAMGFTGKKAAEFKEAFIAEFNRMEKALVKPGQKAFDSVLNNPLADDSAIELRVQVPCYQRFTVKLSDSTATLSMYLNTVRAVGGDADQHKFRKLVERELLARGELEVDR